MTEVRLFPWLEKQWLALLVMRDRLPQALLFHGAQGLGKLAFAQHFAQAMLCEAPSLNADSACGRCGACALFKAGTHPDYLLVQPQDESQEEGESASAQVKASALISVAAIRALTDFNQISSSRGRSKIVVLHPAEAMNRNAANALLKTLEEPMSGLRIVLVSHLPGRLPATIRSRCSAVAFAQPDRDLAIQWLEGQRISDAAAALDHAAGAPLLARDQQADPRHASARQAAVKALVGNGDPALIVDEMMGCEPDLMVTLLQKYALDQLALKLAGRAIYQSALSPSSNVAQVELDAPFWVRWYQALVSEARCVHHPLNPRLRCERILNSVPRAADN